MKLKCNYCEIVIYKTRDEAIDLGWNRAIISQPVRKTLTACPDHFKQFAEELIQSLKKNRGII